MTSDTTTYRPKNSLDRIWFNAGRMQGRCELLQIMLEHQWGPLSEEQYRLLHSLDFDQFSALACALLGFNSRDDLDQWLEANPCRIAPILDAVRNNPDTWYTYRTKE